MASSVDHVRKVRMLYKVILRLHRGLPVELKAIGDAYVKEEFRHHKDASTEYIPHFMKEWATYALTLTKQLRQNNPEGLGQSMSTDHIHLFSDDQANQLLELYKETQKPIDQNSLNENTHPDAGGS